jgi:hypothetical protein
MIRVWRDLPIRVDDVATPIASATTAPIPAPFREVAKNPYFVRHRDRLRSHQSTRVSFRTIVRRLQFMAVCHGPLSVVKARAWLRLAFWSPH